MSWLSKQLKSAGKVVKKGAKALGKGWEAIDDYAAPAIGFALGGPGGAALGAAAARATGNGKFDPKATLMAGAKGYGLGALGSAAGLAGGQGLKTLGGSAVKALANPIATGGNLIKSQLGMGGGANAAQVAGDPTAGGMIGSWRPPTGAAQMAGGGGGGAMDMLKKVGSFALDNKDLLLGGLAGYEGYKSDKQADALRKRQLELAMQNWEGTAPLRTMGQSMMLDQQREDLSGIARNRNNPFA